MLICLTAATPAAEKIVNPYERVRKYIYHLHNCKQ